MRYFRHLGGTLVSFAGLLLITGCNPLSNRAKASTECRQAAATSAVDDSWRPKWDTTADKGKTEKPSMRPILFFVKDGFHGSPIPRSNSEKEQEARYREAFSKSFRERSGCYGLTLKLKESSDADFGLQIFRGIDGREGRWQWVLYRMDTMGAKVTGEDTGESPDGMVDSVCSSMRDAAFSRGGSVE